MGFMNNLCDSGIQ